MSFDQKEEFSGSGRTISNLRRNAWLGLLFELAFGIVFVTMWWWMSPDDLTPGAGAVKAPYIFGYLVSPLIGLYFLYRFARDAMLFFRTPLGKDTEVLWYVLDPKGLHIKHDLERFAPSHITPGEFGPECVVEWSAMKSVATFPGTSPKVKIVRRPPGAVIDRTLTLVSGQRSCDGALFEDRLSLWFAEKSAGMTATPMMTGALPSSRDALQEIKKA